MKLKKVLTVLFCLVIAFTFAACGGDDKENTQEFGPLFNEAKSGYADSIGDLSSGTVGDSLSNSFFDWTLNSVETKDSLEGKKAKDGYKFVVANITVKNKTKDEYAVGNYDFIGLTGLSDDDQLDTMDAFYDDMYPDEKNLGAGKTLEGDLVFQVKEDREELIIDYQEFYEDDSIGNTNWFYIKL